MLRAATAIRIQVYEPPRGPDHLLRFQAPSLNQVRLDEVERVVIEIYEQI
jgi:hypothetical protein